jgi:hypothetical protein
LILLGLLKMTKGDFRAGMFFNAIALGVLAIFMVLAARHLRGKTKFANAFFPVALGSFIVYCLPLARQVGITDGFEPQSGYGN